jgi:RHS repeat-associated protein
VLNKNGAFYSFDYGNRLRSSPSRSYRYDAEGRSVRQDNVGTDLIYSVYAKDGRLVWQRDDPGDKRINNVYLAGSLVAELSRPLWSIAETLTYVHTDALGSPIARTNSAGTVIERSEYEPYGKLLNRPNDDRAGYTGHVMDSASGLTYMQQRYYDPQIGRFLSVDPVTADGNTGSNFHRYWYANNNPYKFTDPDGRYICDGTKQQCASVEQGIQDIRSAASQLKEGSTERAILDRVVDFYGEADHDNDVTVQVVAGDSKAGSAVTVGSETTITYNPLAHGEGYGGTVDTHERAATLAHEGNHGVDQKRWGMTNSLHRREWNEKRAVTAEAAYFKGANQDARTGIWTRAGGIDANKVDRRALRSLEMSCPAGGTCE